MSLEQAWHLSDPQLTQAPWTPTLPSGQEFSHLLLLSMNSGLHFWQLTASEQLTHLGSQSLHSLVLGFTNVPRGQVGKHFELDKKELVAHIEHLKELSGWHTKQSAWTQGVQTPARFVD